MSDDTENPQTEAPDVALGTAALSDEDESARAFDEALAQSGSVAEDESELEETQTDTEDEQYESPAVEVNNEGEADQTNAEDEPGDSDDDEEEAGSDDDAITEEIKTLGLRDQAAKRFRELSSRPDTEEATRLRERAELADQLVDSWASIGASAEQVQMAQQYIGAINSGNPDQLIAVAKAFRQQAEAWEQQLGIGGEQLPPDLAAEVEEMNLSAERAREIAQARALEAQRQQYGARLQQSQAQQEQLQQSVQAAKQAIDGLDAELQRADPEGYAAKLPYMVPIVQMIRDTKPPQEWSQAVLAAYQQMPAPPPQTAEKPRIGRQPVRPQGANTPFAREPKDSFEAFDLAIRS